MLPGTGLYRCSVTVSGAAFRLQPHIFMLSTAGVELSVLLYSVGLIIPGREVLGWWWQWLKLLLLRVRSGWIPFISTNQWLHTARQCTAFLECDMMYCTSVVHQAPSAPPQQYGERKLWAFGVSLWKFCKSINQYLLRKHLPFMFVQFVHLVTKTSFHCRCQRTWACGTVEILR